MTDGANTGISASRALETIIGGKEQPTDDEQAAPEQVRERVMGAPSPLEGLPIFDRDIEDGYSLATNCIAKAFILAEQESPGILEKELYYPDDYPVESIRGKKRDDCDAVWQYVMDKWPEFDDWIGGASGFMVGFGYNTARYIIGKPPTSNPAIIEIDV